MNGTTPVNFSFWFPFPHSMRYGSFSTKKKKKRSTHVKITCTHCVSQWCFHFSQVQMTSERKCKMEIQNHRQWSKQAKICSSIHMERRFSYWFTSLQYSPIWREALQYEPIHMSRRSASRKDNCKNQIPERMRRAWRRGEIHRKKRSKPSLMPITWSITSADCDLQKCSWMDASISVNTLQMHKPFRRPSSLLFFFSPLFLLSLGSGFIFYLIRACVCVLPLPHDHFFFVFFSDSWEKN